jgi:hypothetical protein
VWRSAFQGPRVFAILGSPFSGKHTLGAHLWDIGMVDVCIDESKGEFDTPFHEALTLERSTIHFAGEFLDDYAASSTRVLLIHSIRSPVDLLAYFEILSNRLIPVAIIKMVTPSTAALARHRAAGEPHISSSQLEKVCKLLESDVALTECPIYRSDTIVSMIEGYQG